MKKYLVNIQMPTSVTNYDAYLPANKKIGEATLLLAGIAESLSNGAYHGSEESVLLNADNGEPFERNITVYDAGIRNSSRLILI
jgi:hypothetical protein